MNRCVLTETEKNQSGETILSGTAPFLAIGSQDPTAARLPLGRVRRAGGGPEAAGGQAKHHANAALVAPPYLDSRC